MKVKYIPQTISFLALLTLARGFTTSFPQKGTAAVHSFSLSESQENSRAGVVALRYGRRNGGGEEGKKKQNENDQIVQDLQNQQSEHAYWMSQQPQTTGKDAMSKGQGSYNETEYALLVEELEEDLALWKNRFHEMRFKWVRENGRRQKQVQELKAAIKSADVAPRDDEDGLKAELSETKKNLEEALETIHKNEEKIAQLRSNQENLWALTKTGFRLVRSSIMKTSRRIFHRRIKDVAEETE